jgi:hypothetical protein
MAVDDSLLAEAVRAHDRGRVVLMERLHESLRRARQTVPAPSRIILPGDSVPASPDVLEPEALHMLVLVRGLTALVCDQALPLSPDKAAAWLAAWEPQLDCGS